MSKLKTKTKTTKFREPYYNLTDSINAFQRTVGTSDVKLKELAKKMSELSSKINKHLEDNYIWD